MRDFGHARSESRCLKCAIRTEKYFCNLSHSNKQMIEALQVPVNFPKGSKLFIEGQPAKGIHILCCGRVKLSTCSEKGKIIILQIAEPGEILGLSSALSGSNHATTAEALDFCQINFVRIDHFARVLEQNSEVCLNTIKQMNKNLSAARLQICSLGLSATVADKFLNLLLDWCAAVPEGHDGIVIDMTFTHEEIGQMIGTSRETVTRLLKDFGSRNLIRREGSKLLVPDVRTLQAAIGS